MPEEGYRPDLVRKMLFHKAHRRKLEATMTDTCPEGMLVEGDVSSWTNSVSTRWNVQELPRVLDEQVLPSEPPSSDCLPP